MLAAVLVPVKRFGDAKRRLAGTLDPQQRVELARWMATGVVTGVRPLPTFVACDDQEVASWAESLGAHVIWGEGLGLNGAIDDGVRHIATTDVEHVIVAHADLPLPGHLVDVGRPGCVTLVPDRRRDGTNVMSFPVVSPITASYGAGSFRRHLAEAFALGPEGVSVEVRTDTELSIDLDTAEDLNHPMVTEVLPTWLRTSLANRALR